ncbi:MAG: 16S rRNA (cytosine(967)-C(5))-methyltransferase RsmB [Lachnospiraceae bacterium]|nr:16S rRNA (cytosine(967)-C(5))-methyltransferase RsmB [Lachnospiraceae bacterium]
MNAREFALKMLLKINEEQVLSHEALKALDQSGLEPRDRSLATKLVHGTLERQLTIDWILVKKTGKPVSKMKPCVRNILRMGVYQLLFLSQIPASAVCNESVKLTKKNGYAGLSGFVNGVLRGLSRDIEAAGSQEEALATFAKEYPEKERFCFLYSVPEELADYYRTNYPGEAEEMFRAFLSESGVSIRWNKSRGSLDELKAVLQKEDIPFRDGLLPNTLRLMKSGSPAGSEAFRKGLFSIQDESSALAGNLTPLKKGMKVLDLCAAPGGKTVHAADELTALGGGSVTARDLSAEKTERIREHADRVGLSNVTCEKRDALQYEEALKEAYDIVLADLPCSGLGVISRKPDVKWKTSLADAASLASVQRDILKNAVRYVKKGGYLCYSTCTITKEENDRNCDFIESLGLVPYDVTEAVPEVFRKRYQNGRLQLFPQDGTDGFFIAVFRKKDDADGQN